ncbi:unnamed protein product [Bursaphelenchus okinawaensis]|uniref:Uncharacterized protein n=1 Tax=Bursaphelenchus okinawaensis TaxID=465554 RepID=A0A811KTD6_9BILA|nr:unnamed protein product [Bursaphelenchus okinawaensis]CAG9112004.1 unnamed protein product [Bursaphelenchus okinawaensis]
MTPLGLILFVGLTSQLASAFLTPQQNAKLNQVCSTNPDLYVCALAEYLDASLTEMESFPVADSKDAASGDKAFAAARMQKRKSAFVRFGKRAPNSEFAPAELPLNIPLEGILNSRPARKSSYIRFG